VIEILVAVANGARVALTDLRAHYHPYEYGMGRTIDSPCGFYTAYAELAHSASRPLRPGSTAGEYSPCSFVSYGLLRTYSRVPLTYKGV